MATCVRHILLTALLPVLIGGLAGCGNSTVIPDTLMASRGYVTPFGPTPLFHPARFQQTVHDAAKVQHLYTVMLGLNKISPYVLQNCEKDYGLQYALTFLSG